MKKLCVFLLVCFCCCVATSAYVITSPHLWNKLILTHHWPTTFCGMEHCHVNLSDWTLHGLWPDNGQDCNNSWHFNSSLIEDLMPDMQRSWPDLKKPASSEFWKYEWHKHGTCAARAPSLDSEHKYFSKALELYHKLDLTGSLTRAGIVPSESYLSFEVIQDAILKLYQVKPKIQCHHPGKAGQTQILGQIEICFDTQFQLESCVSTDATKPLRRRSRDSGLSVCDPNLPVYYPPAKPTNGV